MMASWLTRRSLAVRPQLLYGSLRLDSPGAHELLCAVREHLAWPCLPRSLRCCCRPSGSATLLSLTLHQLGRPCQLRWLSSIVPLFIKIEAAVRAFRSCWLALQAALKAQCMQLAPLHQLVCCSLCMHQRLHQLPAPAWQPTPLSDSIIHPAAGTMLCRAVDLSYQLCPFRVCHHQCFLRGH